MGNDDTHAQFKPKEQSREFQWILNKQNKHIQFTIEDENEEKYLNLLDIKLKDNNGRYEFDVHCKQALPNVQIKPHYTLWHNYQHIQRISCKSYQNLFWKIFEDGIEYLTDVFCENGHDRETLLKIINNFERKTRTINNNNNNNNNNNIDKKQTPFLRYQKSDQKSKKKCKILDSE